MTPKTQRIGIFVIAIIMVVGTLGSFAMLVLEDRNRDAEIERAARQQEEQRQEQQRLADELSSEYYPIFKEYEDRPTEFDAEAVGDEVTHTDLKKGDGETIDSSSVYRAYYIGWNPNGEVFDGSFNGDKLKAPLPVAPGGLIPGWYEGVEGMKLGGVREITLPAEFAYGEQGGGEKIPPNTPIKFIVMAIPADEE